MNKGSKKIRMKFMGKEELSKPVVYIGGLIFFPPEQLTQLNVNPNQKKKKTEVGGSYFTWKKYEQEFIGTA